MKKKKGAKRARASEREGKEQQLGFTRISRRCVSRETKTERSLGRGKPFVASMPTLRNRKMSDDSFSFPFFFRHGSAPRLSFFSFQMQISTRRGVTPFPFHVSRCSRPPLARPPAPPPPSPPSPPLFFAWKRLGRKNIRRLGECVYLGRTSTIGRGAIFPTASIPFDKTNSKRRRNQGSRKV